MSENVSDKYKYKHIKSIANAYMTITFEQPVPLMVASKIIEQTCKEWAKKDNWNEYLALRANVKLPGKIKG